MSRAGFRASLVLAAVMAIAGSALAASIEVQPTAITTALALDATSTLRIVKIAELTITAARGCSVWITGGSLARAGGSSIPFQIIVVDRGSLAPPPTAFAIGGYRFATTSVKTSVDVYIKYRPDTLQAPGNYTASVAIDVVDN